ncbi:MAG TPA: hypothetical protein VK338_06205 [Candidatus Nitrosocosmicus sp.]|nr:hypothetical protein [Candidatus Nitrosocosmicus sp.]
MQKTHTNMLTRNKDITSVFIVTAVILMIPLIAMMFTDEVDWNFLDFALMGILLSGTGLLIVLASRKIKNITDRIAIIVGIVMTLFLTWVHLAVGIVDSLPFAGS